jgi:hypothetical protein
MPETLYIDVSYLDIKTVSGMMAFLVVDDGMHSDTMNLSRQVFRAKSDPVHLPKPGKWYPVWSTAVLDKKAPENALSALAGSGGWYTRESFRLMRWLNKDWTEYARSRDGSYYFNPAQLMWVCVRTPGSFDLGSGKTVSFHTPYALEVPAQRWIDFGLPFKFDVRLADVISASSSRATQLRFYKWKENTDYYVANALHVPGSQTPGEQNPNAVLDSSVLSGFTVYNPTSSAVTLSIPPVPRAISSAPAKKAGAVPGWSIRIDGQSKSGMPANGAVCSFVPGKGQRRYFPAPPSFSPVSISVFDEEDRAEHGYATAAQFSDGGVDFCIKVSNTSAAAQKVHMQATPLCELGNTMLARILNPETLEWEQLDEMRSVTVGARSSAYRFLAVGTERYIASYTQRRGLFKAALCGAYPNPFSSRMSIRYSLPWADIKNCEFSIYSISGRRVWYHRIENAGPGYAQVVWNGRTEKGQKIAAGAYIIRMRINYNGTKKAAVFKQRIVRLR